MRGGSVNYGGMDDGYVPDYHTGRRISATQYQQQQYEQVHNCFVHSIFLSFGFWYFGHFSCVIFFPFFQSCPSCLAKCKQRLRNIFVFS